MKILCPHCGVEGAADDSYTGKEVRCPRCKVIFEIISGGGKSLHEDVDEPVSEIPGKYVLEDELPEEPVEAQKWSDIASEADLEAEDIYESGETFAESSLEVAEKIETGFDAGGREKNVAGASVPGDDVASALLARGFQGNDSDLADHSSTHSGFSIMGVIKDAWVETRGAKASIWAGSSVMYLVMFIAAVAGTFLMPALGLDMTTTTGMAINVAVQGFLSLISIVFTAGLLYMGVRKAAGDIISWKIVFTGFSFTGQIILATVLQAILVGLGFLLLVLPGIYLTIGYGLTLPLILDRKMSAWEAMETSRKAIHMVWWKVAGVLFLMSFIYTVSAIPLGIGLIWTVPMFIVLVGVVYRCLFGAGKMVR